MTRQWVGILSALAVTGVIVAQTPEPAERKGQFSIAIPAPAAGGADVMMYRAEHVAGAPAAGVSFIASEFSFEGGVVKNAPYSAQAVTETAQRLADGNRIAHKTTADLYRDSDGRTRREETINTVGPWASNAEPFQTIFINDPVSKTSLVLNTRNKTVEKMTTPEVRPMPARRSTGAKSEMGTVGVMGGMVSANRVTTWTAAAPADPAAPDQNSKTEPLPAQTIEGVRAEGARTTVTIPAGSIGNDLAIEIVSERWYSPELQTVVMTRRNDPRMGETVYRLINIRRSEPARSLFEAPADYAVVNQMQFKGVIDENLNFVRDRVKE